MSEEDNGKTSEQLLAEKKEKFNTEPERFVDMDNLIVAVARTPRGISHYIGSAARSELNIAKSEVQFQIDKVLGLLEAGKNEKRIITGGSKTKGAFGMFRR